MKKINFKVILVLILVFALVLSIAACNKDKDEEPTPSPSTGKDYLTPLNEILAGLDQRINGVGDLTERLEADIEFYATVNGKEYLVSLKANVDITEDAEANDDNKLAFEITEKAADADDADLILGFYYNGADEAFILDIPSKDIKRYIDGFNLLNTMDGFDRPEEGFLSFLQNDISLRDLIGEYISYASIAFSDVQTTKSGTVTTYDFTINAPLLNSLLPPVLGALSDYEEGIESVISELFGVDGFKITEIDIPDFELHVLASVDSNQGLTNFGIDLNVPSFTFYLNDADKAAKENGIEVNALDLQAGINIDLAPAGDEFSIDFEVPEIDGYEFFSPLNVNTSGKFLYNGSDIKFIVQTDINPFKLTEAEGFIFIETKGEEEAEYITKLKVDIFDGDVFIKLFDDYDEEDNPVYDMKTFEIQDAIDFVKNIIDDLDSIKLPNFDKMLDNGEEEEESEPIDINAIIGIITSLPDQVVDGVLTLDKEFIENAINTLGIEDAEIPEDVLITAWLNYDDADNFTGARAELYALIVEYAKYEDGFDGTKYSPVFGEDDEGEYKKVGENYVLIDDEEYEGTRYAITGYEEDEDGLYEKIENEIRYFVEFSISENDDEQTQYALAAGIIQEEEVEGETELVDVIYAQAVFTIIPQEGYLDGFNFTVTLLDEDMIDLTLSDFTFSWSYEIDEDDFDDEYKEIGNTEDYDNLIDDPETKAAEVIELIQEMLYDFFGETIYLRNLYNDDDISYIKAYAGEPITLPTPTREDYEFDGWYLDDEFSEEFEETVMPEGGAELYAKWTPVQ